MLRTPIYQALGSRQNLVVLDVVNERRHIALRHHFDELSRVKMITFRVRLAARGRALEASFRILEKDHRLLGLYMREYAVQDECQELVE